jgi:hypothetical protein
MCLRSTAKLSKRNLDSQQISQLADNGSITAFVVLTQTELKPTGKEAQNDT